MDFNSKDILTGLVSYSNSDKELRARFVREYLRDYSSYSACVRMGFIDDVALEHAKMFMADPYVLTLMADAESSRAEHLRNEKTDLSTLPADFTPHNFDEDKQRIVSALFREAFFKGPGASHSSRVAALGKLSDIYKLTKDEGNKEAGISSNVMVVPAMGSVDNWEKAAAEQQLELKRTVTE